MGNATSQFLVRRIEPADSLQVRDLFRDVFGQELSAQLHEWKYGGGRGCAWGAWDAHGTLLLHCGVLFRDVLAAGETRRIAQLCDLMASPNHGAGLARHDSPFYQVVDHLLKSLPGPENPDALAFGFPSERAMRLGEHLGVFREIDRMFDLSIAPGSRKWNADRIESASDEEALRLAAQLWPGMASQAASGLMGVRDAAWIQHRYLRHPVHRYRCLAVRSFWRRRPVGLLVINGEGEERELVDIIGAPGQLPRILRAAQAWLGATGGRRLSLWLSSSHVASVKDLAESVQPLQFRIMANPFTPAAMLQRLDKRWWLTRGDTDYL